MSNKKELPNKGFTHGGKFHADDVFSTAFLRYINPEIVIERGYQVPDDFDGIVYDIGLGEYDHHQEDAEIRENGIPYAAFGLLWRSFSDYVLEKELADKLEESFIQPLDLSDNTGCKNEVAELVSLFNPTWDSEMSVNDAFEEAVSFASKILINKFTKLKSVKKADAIVEEALKDAKDNILILNIGVPWKHSVIDTEIEFCVYPSDRGGFGAQGVPIEKDSMELKIPFPKEWRGKRDDEIAAISGIPGLRFCHNSGFLIACETLEDTIAACHKAREEYRK